MRKVVFILGPTGVGKSEVAISLAKRFDGEIISADSVQIFQGFDIGSAKLTKKQMCGINHYGIDICQPSHYFSTYDFVLFTRQKIKEIFAHGKLPIVVGGTGLYVKALIGGFNFGQTEKHDKFRAEQEEYAKQFGNLALWERLKKLDSVQAEKIPPNNVKRVIRALEIATFGSKKEKSDIDFEAKVFVLNLDRQLLYERLNSRVDKMLKQGLIDEVKGLLNSGINLTCQPMQAIGYKEIASYLQGEISEEEAISLVKQHTRNYAKRQMTFFRGMEDVEFVDMGCKNSHEQLCEKIKLFLEEKHES